MISLLFIFSFSHANSGEIILGNLTLDSNTLNTRADDLKALGTHLNQSGDILLYGCDVSSGFIGLDFVNEFALLTGADIAASAILVIKPTLSLGIDVKSIPILTS